MASTYTPIATTTLVSASSSVSFSSIAGAYTDLVLIGSGTSTASLQVKIALNASSVANYSWTGMSGNSSSAESYRTTNSTYIYPDYYYSFTTTNGFIELNVMNYASTNMYKTLVMRSGNAGTATMANVGLWRSTTAVQSIDLTTSTSTFAAGTTFTLYGIKAA